MLYYILLSICTAGAIAALTPYMIVGVHMLKGRKPNGLQ